MKKALTVFVTVLLLCTCVSARFSPALDIISEKLRAKRCMTNNTVMSFSASDFDSLFLREVEAVVVNSLPDQSAGVLTLSGTAVREGQTVDREMFEFLKFSPDGDFTGNAEVIFSAGTDKAGFTIGVLDEVNYPPETGAQAVKTGSGIAVYSTFSAADPDGDGISFEVVKYPDHGSIGIRDGDGVFVYRPADGYIGGDSFTYRAIDVFGNASSEQTVKIKVSKPSAGVYFDDMKNHWAHNSAVRMASTGLMVGTVDGEGKLNFNPEAEMTRGDFLALCLIMSGKEPEIPMVSKTVFADDSVIPSNIRSYASYAFDKGIINGFDNGDGSINFESAGSITKAEAAVIISRILALDEKEGDKPAYKDAAAIPVWADSAVGSLTSCGILKGAPGGEILAGKVLTRAEGAELICNVADYVEDKREQEEKAKKPKGFLSNLFRRKQQSDF